MTAHFTARFHPCASLLLCALAAWSAHASPDDRAAIARGQAAIEHRGCAACHVIPGVTNHAGNVGPPLNNIANRAYVAGVLANTQRNMQRWLRDPPAVKPGTAMPNMGIAEGEAQDIAAYLGTLD